MGDNKSFQIFVKGMQGKTTTYDVQADESCESFMKKVHAKTMIQVDEMRLLYIGKQLDKKNKLSDYGIQKSSTLHLVLRLKGGSYEKTEEQDMITWDDSPTNPRAKMSCGHAITPESLLAYCMSILTAGRFIFYCPNIDRKTGVNCRKEWQYVDVRLIASLGETEQIYFETKINENYMLKASGIQQCPQCSSYCERMNNKDNRVVCPVCSTKKQSYEFCWFCLHKWKSSLLTHGCGNEDCTGVDPRLTYLSKVSLKKVGSVDNVPSCRACIKCGMLIEHDSKCKHMLCRCGQQFCFICLKPKSGTSWKCGSYNDACAVAPIQTQIPGQ